MAENLNGVSVVISGRFEAVYVSTPKGPEKPVYVQCLPAGQKYPQFTLAFPQKDCPVTRAGQVFSGRFTGQYQVYTTPKGEKDRHSFMVHGLEDVKYFQTVVTEIK